MHCTVLLRASKGAIHIIRKEKGEYRPIPIIANKKNPGKVLEMFLDLLYTSNESSHYLIHTVQTRLLNRRKI